MEDLGIGRINHKLKICLIFLIVKQIPINSVFGYFSPTVLATLPIFSFPETGSLSGTQSLPDLTVSQQALEILFLPYHTLGATGTHYKISSYYETLAFLFLDSKNHPHTKHLGKSSKTVFVLYIDPTISYLGPILKKY